MFTGFRLLPCELAGTADPSCLISDLVKSESAYSEFRLALLNRASKELKKAKILRASTVMK